MSLSIRLSSDKAFVTRLALTGRLDTITAPELESELDSLLEKDIGLLLLDFAALEYISSAGLRVLFRAMAQLNAAGSQCAALKMQARVKKVFDIVQAMPPDVPIFDNDKELDEYLSTWQYSPREST
jgi:anti-anti-sigma factor